MTNLGQWAPYIDEAELRSWYALPASMEAEARTYHPDGRELRALDKNGFAHLRRQAVGFADSSVAPYRPMYHHAIHFREVEARGLAAAGLYAQRNQRAMPEAVRQAFGLALYTHDAYHCASTFRMDAPRGIYRPELGVKVSTEWVTALAVNGFMKDHGLSFPARLFQTGVIWASTYGGMAPKGASLGIPTPQPRTIWGAIMRAADACPHAEVEEHFRRSIAVTYGEVPAIPAAATMTGLITGERSFVNYVEQMFNQLDQVASSNLTAQLGWRARLSAVRLGLDKLQAGDRKMVALMHREVRRYGRVLD